jgi:Protein of unknown function (DUF3108)
MRAAQTCLIVAALSTGLSGGEQALGEDAAAPAKRIVAIYRIGLGNSDLGTFGLTTTFHGPAYEIRGEGRFSVLGGLVFQWRGSTATLGNMTNAGPQPATYGLNYSGGGAQTGQVRMSFHEGVVDRVSLVPPEVFDPHVLPVDKAQLEGVLDPMSAVFLHAHSDNPNADTKVCQQRVPVFDGVQRFDLVLTPKRAVHITRDQLSSYSGLGVICRVKYVPLGGYRPDDPSMRLMSTTTEIEVWLVPLSGTDMYVPYRIVLPTPMGYATALATSFEVHGAKHVSLDH